MVAYWHECGGKRKIIQRRICPACEELVIVPNKTVKALTTRQALSRVLEETMTVVEKLKGLNLDRIEFDEALELYAHAGMIGAAYSDFAAEPPEWLLEAKASLSKHIKERRRDAIAHELKLTDAALNGLKTAEEKRAELRAKAERLKAQLG